MKFASSVMMRLCFAISNRLTNLARETDSDPNSRPNLELQEAMQNSSGWSPQFPLVVVSMKNWPFTKEAVGENGCTAQEYIDAEMGDRATKWAEFRKNAVSADGRFACDAFEGHYCEVVPVENPEYAAKKAEYDQLKADHDLAVADFHNVKPKKGEKAALAPNPLPEFTIPEFITPDDPKAPKRLVQLTIENANWVHAGHQRTQVVILPATALFLKRNHANGLTLETQEDGTELGVQHEVHGWEWKIPTVLGTYTDMMDILRDQLGVNSSAGKQNPLTIRDYIKGAAAAIGRKMTMGMSERGFRDMCAETTLGGKKANSGAAPRRAYLTVSIDWYYQFQLRLIERINNPAKTKINNETVDNPEYIDLAELQLDHEDPRCDVSVISRICEPSLKKLNDYVKNYGRYSKRVQQEKKADEVSALEYEILDRNDGKGLAWSIDEAKAWIAGKCKGAPLGIRQKPQLAEKVKAFDPNSLKEVAQAAMAPDYLRDYLAAKLGISKAAGVEIDPEAEDRILSLKSPMDGIYKLNTKSVTEKLCLSCVDELLQLKEGNPEAFVSVCNGLRTLLDGVVKPGTAIVPGPTAGTDAPSVETAPTVVVKQEGEAQIVA